VSKSKIVHLTSVHQPFDTRIFHKQCKSLAASGHEVVLVAPHTHDEVVDGVRIRAIPRARVRWKRMFLTTLHVFCAAVQENAVVYHFHDPELIPVGILLRGMGKRVLFDAHEDLPMQISSKYWIPSYLRKSLAAIAAAVEAAGSQLLSGIIAATPLIASRFPKHKTAVVQNYPILSELTPAQPVPYHERSNSIVYIGGISLVRGLQEMLLAMQQVPGSAELVMAGLFQPENLEAQAKVMPGWNRVRYLGWQSRTQVARLLADMRVGVVVLHPEPNYLESYPVKLFEYMAAGVPVVASDFPLWRSIIEGAGCGLTVNPRDPAAIARAVTWLLEHPVEAAQMGLRGQRAVRLSYNWDAEARTLLDFYRTVLR
jgi:glycosyltransferase involved in cell wall biosynthesis